MGEYWTAEYAGEPFRLFGAAHLLALLSVFVVTGAFFLLGDRVREDRRPLIRHVLASVLLVNELSWHVWAVSVGRWDLKTMLPLHICSALVWISIILLLTRSHRLYELVYFLGLAGATQALLTPDIGPYGYPHFRFFQALIGHGLIVVVAIYMTGVEGYRPTWRSVVRAFVGLNLLALLSGIVNYALGSNYVFTARKPDTASLLDWLPAWPWYIPVVELIALVLFGLLFLPFLGRERDSVVDSVRIRRHGSDR